MLKRLWPARLGDDGEGMARAKLERRCGRARPAPTRRARPAPFQVAALRSASWRTSVADEPITILRRSTLSPSKVKSNATGSHSSTLRTRCEQRERKPSALLRTRAGSLSHSSGGVSGQRDADARHRPPTGPARRSRPSPGARRSTAPPPVRPSRAAPARCCQARRSTFRATRSRSAGCGCGPPGDVPMRDPMWDPGPPRSIAARRARSHSPTRHRSISPADPHTHRGS